MLVRPIITERSMQEAGRKRYAFEVGIGDNKKQIGQEVAKQFGVTVVDVATSIRHGKIRRSGKKRTVVVRPDWKIAFVTIKPTQKIELFETNTTQAAATTPTTKDVKSQETKLKAPLKKMQTVKTTQTIRTTKEG